MDFDSLMYTAATQVKDANVRKKGYSLDLPPPKREKKKPKTGPRSAVIQAFLDKKEADKKAKEVEEKKKRDEYMAQLKPKKFKIPKASQNESSKMEDKASRSPSKPKSQSDKDIVSDPPKYVSEEASKKHKEFMQRVEDVKRKSHDVSDDSSDDSSDDDKRRKKAKPEVVKKPTPPAGPMDFASLMKFAHQRTKGGAETSSPEPRDKPATAKAKTPISGRDLIEKELASSTKDKPKLKAGPKSFKMRQKEISQRQVSSPGSHSRDSSPFRSSGKTTNGCSDRSTASKSTPVKSAPKWPADAPRHIPSAVAKKDATNLKLTQEKSGMDKKKNDQKRKEDDRKKVEERRKEEEKRKEEERRKVEEKRKEEEDKRKSKEKLQKKPVKEAAPRRPVEDGAARWEALMKSNRQKSESKKASKRRRIESDDEYDSEMDDFIDDGDGEGNDYSSAIREIFGYDKSKYKYANEDSDDDMETNFSSIMKEERISAKLGLKEDLEDIRREEEELKRKAAKKKAATSKKKR